MDILSIIIIVAVLAMFAAMIICVRKDKELVGFYREFKVCSRLYVYFTMDFILCGIGCIIMIPVSIAMMIAGNLEKFVVEMGGSVGVWFAIIIIGGILFTGLGILMYRRARNKCPEHLRKRFWKDMLIMFFGMNFRLAFFFVVFLGISIWYVELRVTEYEVDGHIFHTYGFGDELYDENGTYVGKLTSYNKAVITNTIYKKL